VTILAEIQVIQGDSLYKRKDLIPQIPSRYSDRGLRIDENKDMGKDEIEAYLSRDFYESAAFDLLSFLETKSPST
jgi:hypothetical protein